MAMSELQVLDSIVRPVLADSLGMTEREERDIWLTCKLVEDLGVTEPEDWTDIAWRLGHKMREHRLDIGIYAQELEGQCKTVADVLTLVCHKLDEVEVSASEVVTLNKLI